MRIKFFLIVLLFLFMLGSALAFEQCLDYSDSPDTRKVEFLLDEDDMIDFSTVVLAGVLGNIEIEGQGDLKFDQRKWYIEQFMELSGGTGVLPLVNGQELLAESLGGYYGYYHYVPTIAPWNPIANEQFGGFAYDPIDDWMTHPALYGFKTAFPRGVYNEPLGQQRYDEYMGRVYPQDIFVNEDGKISFKPTVNRVHSSVLTANVPFSLDDAVIKGYTLAFDSIPELKEKKEAGIELTQAELDLLASNGILEIPLPADVIEKMKSEKGPISHCSRALPAFFWTGLRETLPEYVVIEVANNLTCEFELDTSKIAEREHYDPLEDIYETGYISIKMVDSVDYESVMHKAITLYEIPAKGSGLNLLSWPAELATDAALSNTFFKHRSAIVVRDGHIAENQGTALAEFIGEGGGYSVEIVSPTGLPFCESKNNFAELSSDEKRKLFFANMKKVVSGKDQFELDMDEIERKVVADTFFMMKDKASSDYMKFMGTNSTKNLGSRVSASIGYKTVKALGTYATHEFFQLSIEKIPKELSLWVAESARAESLSKIAKSLSSSAVNTPELRGYVSSYLHATLDIKAIDPAVFNRTSINVGNTTKNLIDPLGITISGRNTAGLGPNAFNTLLTQNPTGPGEWSLQNVLTKISDAATDVSSVEAVDGVSRDVADALVKRATEELVQDPDWVSDVSKLNKAAGQNAISSLKHAGRLYSIFGNQVSVLKQMEVLSARLGANETADRMIKSRLTRMAASLGDDLGKSFKTVVSAGDNAAIDAFIKTSSEASEKTSKEIASTLTTKTWWRKGVLSVSNWGRAFNTLLDRTTIKFLSSKWVGVRWTGQAIRTGVGGIRGVGQLSFGLGKKLMPKNFVTGFVWGEIIGATLTIAARGYCIGLAKLMGDDYATFNMGVNCTNNVGDKEFSCLLKKEYTLPEEYVIYDQCLFDSWVKWVRRTGSLVGILSDAASYLTWKNTMDDLSVFEDTKIRDLVDVGIYSDTCDVESVRFDERIIIAGGGSYLSKSLGSELDVGAVAQKEPYMDIFDFKIDYSTAKEECKDFSLIFSVRPSKTFTGVLEYVTNPSTGSDKAVGVEGVTFDGLKGEPYLDGVLPYSFSDASNLFDISSDAPLYVAAVPGLTDGGIIQKGGSISPNELFYLKYGFLMETKPLVVRETNEEDTERADIYDQSSCSIKAWQINYPELFSKEYWGGLRLIPAMADAIEVWKSEGKINEAISWFSLYYTDTKGETFGIASGEELYAKQRAAHKKISGGTEHFLMGNISVEGDRLVITGLDSTLSPEEKESLADAFVRQKVFLDYSINASDAARKFYNENEGVIEAILGAANRGLLENVRTNTVAEIDAIAKHVYLYYIDDYGQAQGIAFGINAAKEHSAGNYNQIYFDRCDGWSINFSDFPSKTESENEFKADFKRNFNRLGVGLSARGYKGPEVTEDNLKGILNKFKEDYK
jgi:hypothetical protein